MKNKNFSLMFMLLITLSACDKDESSPILSKTGVFIDSSVENLRYDIAAGSFFTNSDGEFNYQDGETITFSIGAITFPTVLAKSVITPLYLAGTNSATDQQATNIARLLLSLDIDGNPDNGISISPAAEALAYQEVDFNVDASSFENNEVIMILVTSSGSPNNFLVSVAEAQAHLGESMLAIANPSIVGVWRSTNGTAFNYLTLFSDNTFLYAENDLGVETAEENGLEAGTYAYDSNSGNITFNVVYDDNDPGNDSGVGDIGNPVSIKAELSNGNSKLSLADGSLNLNSVGFSTSSIVGVWREINGAAFNYLLLFSDNTFLYAENDLDVISDKENGLEVGTYTYDSNSGIINFNIVYDDNDPDNDSGIGNIGSQVSSETVLSNSNSTLSLAGLIFTKGL